MAAEAEAGPALVTVGVGVALAAPSFRRSLFSLALSASGAEKAGMVSMMVGGGARALCGRGADCCRL